MPNTVRRDVGVWPLLSVLCLAALAACGASAPISRPASGAPSAASPPIQPSASGGVSLREIVRYPIGEDHVETVAFSPDGQRLAMGAEDGTVAIVKLTPGPAEGPAVRKLHVGFTSGLAWSPDGGRLLTAAADGAARMLDPDSMQVAYSLTAYPKTYPAVAWSSDGRQFALAQGRTTVQIYDAAAGALVSSADVTDARTRALLWLPSGDVALADEAGRLSFWTPGQPKASRVFEPTPTHKSINSLSLSPDDKTLAVAYDDGAVLLVDAPTAKFVRDLFRGRQTGTVSWSPNGKLLALTSVAFDLKILDVQGQLVAREDVGYDTNGTAWAPDGKYLAFGADDKTLRIYEVTPSQSPDKQRPSPPSFMGR